MNPLYCDKSEKVVDYYALFNLPYDCDDIAVKAAFRKLIKRYHPDITGKTGLLESEKVETILRAYRVLSDVDMRRDYDRALFQQQSSSAERFPVIPRKRIHYSVKLGDMLKLKQINKEAGRQDVLDAFGQDVEIMVTSLEAKRGAVAYIQLPARMVCPMCRNTPVDCPLCNGLGYVPTTSQLEVKIPPHVDNSTVIDVDMHSMKPSSSISFKNSRLRIRITIE
jgi:DnaJ-class molecular chaperone